MRASLVSPLAICDWAEDRSAEMGVSEGMSEGDRAFPKPDVDKMLAARASVDRGTSMTRAI